MSWTPRFVADLWPSIQNLSVEEQEAVFDAVEWMCEHAEDFDGDFRPDGWYRTVTMIDADNSYELAVRALPDAQAKVLSVVGIRRVTAI